MSDEQAEPSDEQLVLLWCDGDERAGQLLLKRHFSSLYRFFRNKVVDDCDDLIQSTFLALVKGKEAFRGQASFRSYLFVIARHELYRNLRKRATAINRFDPSHSSVEGLLPSPSAEVAGTQIQAIVLTALRCLPVDTQIALELHYWEDLSTSALAEALELPIATVKSRLQRGRRALDKEIRRALRRAGVAGDTQEIAAVLGVRA